MNQCALVFYPGLEPYLGLWRPTKLWFIHELAPGPHTSPALLGELHDFLGQYHVTSESLTHILAMTGPASYSHLRVWLATANTLAWSHRLPLMGFTSDTMLPQAIPDLIAQAKINLPLKAVYPSQLVKN